MFCAFRTLSILDLTAGWGGGNLLNLCISVLWKERNSAKRLKVTGGFLKKYSSSRALLWIFKFTLYKTCLWWCIAPGPWITWRLHLVVKERGSWSQQFLNLCFCVFLDGILTMDKINEVWCSASVCSHIFKSLCLEIGCFQLTGLYELKFRGLSDLLLSNSGYWKCVHPFKMLSHVIEVWSLNRTFNLRWNILMRKFLRDIPAEPVRKFGGPETILGDSFKRRKWSNSVWVWQFKVRYQESLETPACECSHMDQAPCFWICLTFAEKEECRAERHCSIFWAGASLHAGPQSLRFQHAWRSFAVLAA